MHNGKFVESCTLHDELCFNIEVKRKHERRMASSVMLRRVALLRTDVSEELSASIIRVTRIGELGAHLVFLRSVRRLLVTDSCHPDDGCAKFLRNVCSYKSHTA
jgi:hypothetical protein